MASFFNSYLAATFFFQILTCAAGLFRTMASSGLAYVAGAKRCGEERGRKARKERERLGCASQIVNIFNVVLTSKAKNITEPLENLPLVSFSFSY